MRESWVCTSWLVQLTATGTRDGRPIQATDLFLTSLRSNPEALLQLVRDRWSIECWHRVRDIRFPKASHRYRVNGAGALASL
jgi:hypothetical protein